MDHTGETKTGRLAKQALINVSYMALVSNSR
jgi:hypothetical protein